MILFPLMYGSTAVKLWAPPPAVNRMTDPTPRVSDVEISVRLIHGEGFGIFQTRDEARIFQRMAGKCQLGISGSIPRSLAVWLERRSLCR